MMNILWLTLIPLIGGGIAIVAGFWAATLLYPLKKADGHPAAAANDVPPGSFKIGEVDMELARRMEIYGHYTTEQTGRAVLGSSRLAGAE